jgi:parallel beta-helix repeat protein
VQNVQGEYASICIFNFGGSGTISDNSLSDCNDAIAANWSAGTQFIGNTVTNSGSGIHSDNNGTVGD